ncbi:hypothetical protein SteCoe_12060 [Stentor coeruleus]|uniref:Purple acid phosphatase n=1 Tax=Stentor coeruleus TaxID=5963 RepID=A0A1R2CBN3_9CILI|nr:hypothetical protein SteCoe_12060 [Stentor coeruleus]
MDTTYFNDSNLESRFTLANSYKDINPQKNALEVVVNVSNINSGFFFPLNEKLPGSYFWQVYPQQIKIAWTENSREIIVTWISYNNLTGRLAYRKSYCIECSIPSEWIFIRSNVSEYDFGDNFSNIQYIHSVRISELNEDCVYEYLVGLYSFWSELFIIKGKTPNYIHKTVYNKTEEPVKFTIIGDWGTGAQGQYTERLLEKDLDLRPVDGIIHLGDIAYDLDSNNGEVGDEFLRMIQPIAARFPYMTLPGNHEYFKNMTHYTNRFKMPRNNDNQGTGLFYSFNLGYAHFILINTEVYFRPKQLFGINTQDNWLVKDLKKANENREQVPWVFVFMHRPIYCSSIKDDCSSFADSLKNKLEDIFNEYSVDVVFQAHSHIYERTYPIYNGKEKSGLRSKHVYKSAEAPIYIVNGHAGSREGHDSLFKPKFETWHILGFEKDYGYGRLEVYNKTHMYYEEFSSEKGEIIDHFWTIKSKARYNI